jgi:hypothetical protein
MPGLLPDFSPPLTNSSLRHDKNLSNLRKPTSMSQAPLRQKTFIFLLDMLFIFISINPKKKKMGILKDQKTFDPPGLCPDPLSSSPNTVRGDHYPRIQNKTFWPAF